MKLNLFLQKVRAVLSFQYSMTILRKDLYTENMTNFFTEETPLEQSSAANGVIVQAYSVAKSGVVQIRLIMFAKQFYLKLINIFIVSPNQLMILLYNRNVQVNHFVCLMHQID